MQELYTATTKAQTANIPLDLRCPLANAPRYRRHLEVFLEKVRPSERITRLTAVFACDKPELSENYLDGEYRTGRYPCNLGRYLYRLTAGAYSKHPMCLVDQISSCLDTNDLSRAESLAREYWNPTIEWKYYEYLCQRVTIVDEVERPSPIKMSVANMTYEGDRARAKNFIKRSAPST